MNTETPPRSYEQIQHASSILHARALGEMCGAAYGISPSVLPADDKMLREWVLVVYHRMEDIRERFERERADLGSELDELHKQVLGGEK